MKTRLRFSKVWGFVRNTIQKTGRWAIGILVKISGQSVRSFHRLDSKLHNRPDSIDLLVLQHLSHIVAHFPRLKCPPEQTEQFSYYYKSRKSIALQSAKWIARSIIKFDAKLNRREPRMNQVMKGALHSVANIQYRLTQSQLEKK